MGWNYTKPSEAKIRWFKHLYSDRAKFCKEHNIQSSTNYVTYYRFKVNGTYYVIVSDSFLYRYFNQTKGKENSEDCRIDRVFWASKSRLQEIYKNCEKGIELDDKGLVIKKE